MAGTLRQELRMDGVRPVKTAAAPGSSVSEFGGEYLFFANAGPAREETA